MQRSIMGAARLWPLLNDPEAGSLERKAKNFLKTRDSQIEPLLEPIGRLARGMT